MNRKNQLSAEHLSLRLASPSDEDFLASVYAATRRDEFAPFGWSDEQFISFCRMQFALQTQAYKMQFPDARNCVIELDGQAIGRLLVNRDETEIRLIDIAVLPEFRGFGAGKILIESLQREAETAGKPLGLRVLATNASATRLYERLGFVVIENNQTHLTMRWRGSAENYPAK